MVNDLNQNENDIVFAGDGSEAIEMCKENLSEYQCNPEINHLFGLIILDYHMPQVDGLQVAILLKKMYKACNIEKASTPLVLPLGLHAHSNLHRVGV